MKKALVAVTLVAMLGMAGVASAVVPGNGVVVYANNFGTPEQMPDPVFIFDTNLEVNGGGGFTTTYRWGPGSAFGDAQMNIFAGDTYPTGIGSLYADLDGDGLSGSLSPQGWSSTIYMKEIVLPAGWTMTNLSLSALGYGHPSHGSSFAAILSLDGVALDYEAVGQAAWNTPVTVTAVPAFDPAFENINSVWVGIALNNGNDKGHDVWYYAAGGGDLVLTADVTVPEPMTLSLLALGGLALIRRRK